MQYHAGYCLHLFDTTQNIPVDTPDDFEFWSVPCTGDLLNSMRLYSWQVCFASVPGLSTVPGDEKYSVLEGSRIVLRHPGKAPFYFEIPSMPMETGGVPFPQPQATLPALN